MTYQKHRKELLKDEAVRVEHEKLQPEYELARSIIEQRLKKTMTQKNVAQKTDMPQPPPLRGSRGWRMDYRGCRH